jgi:hypothetical protein
MMALGRAMAADDGQPDIMEFVLPPNLPFEGGRNPGGRPARKRDRKAASRSAVCSTKISHKGGRQDGHTKEVAAHWRLLRNLQLRCGLPLPYLGRPTVDGTTDAGCL